MIDWLFQTTFTLTILMLAVLAVRRPVARFFGARWAYALWLLPALHLILPPIDLGAPVVPIPDELTGSIEPVILQMQKAEEGAARSWESTFLVLWLGGALLFGLYQAISYRRFMRRIGIGTVHRPNITHKIGIVESAEVEGPLAIGLLDKWIVVPADFTSRYTPEEQELALRHEWVHHQREDIFWNFAALAVVALNWFNPVAHAAFRAFRSDQELSCDAVVAARASAEGRHDYARALVKSAGHPALAALCPLNHPNLLKRRLRMIKEHRSSRLRNVGGAVVCTALFAASLSISSTGFAQSSQDVVQPAPATVPPELKDGKKHTRIFVREKFEKAGAPGEERVIRHFRGKPGEHPEPMACDAAQKFETDVSEGGDKMKFVICAKDGANMVEHLERAVTRLNSETEISAERRGKIVAALQAEIARRKAAQ